MQIFYSLPNHNTPENLIDIYEDCFQSNVVFFYCVLSICIVYTGVRLPSGPVARGQPKSCWASQSCFVAGPAGQP